MPTYEYECSSCGHQMEVFQHMTEKRLEQCPQCHKNGLQRLIGSGSGVLFKGTGFYETDYKKKTAPKNEPKADPPCSSCCSSKTCPANSDSKAA